jgi:hypothetical protein
MGTQVSTIVTENRSQEYSAGRWCHLFLSCLEEFSRLTWYLVVDNALVEYVILRGLARLHNTEPETDDIDLLYDQARKVLIEESIEVLRTMRRGSFQSLTLPDYPSDVDFPDQERLAFLLKLVLGFPEAEVAAFLGMSPGQARQLITSSIKHLPNHTPVAAIGRA